MNKFIDVFVTNKEYYLELVKNKAYSAVITLYRLYFPYSTSIDINYLGIKATNDFKLYCETNNIDLIYYSSRKSYMLRFEDNISKKELLKAKIDNSTEELKFLETKKVPNLKKQIEVYKNEYRGL